MKPGQLIEINLRNTFPEKLYTKCGGETITRPLLKKSKLSLSQGQCSKILYILSLLFACLRTLESDWN